ncbi:MAG: hypothetical protein AB1813_15085 [Verrucomicrobiota bacterium]
MQITGATTEETPSRLALFVQALRTDGRAVVSPEPLPAGGSEILPLLQEMERTARRELLGDTAPSFLPTVGVWAAQLFYQLCQFVVCREIGASQIAAACRTSCPAQRSPETDWSADLFFQHLPQLFRWARQLSNADPLLDHLNRLAHDWPLSSVGIPGLTQVNIQSFATHPALRRLYADRILAAKDLSRLGEAEIDDLLRADIGIFPDLAPAMAAQLFPTCAPGFSSEPKSEPTLRHAD